VTQSAAVGTRPSPRRDARLPVGVAIPSLVRWGMSADADLVYRTLVNFGPAEAGTVGRDLGLATSRTNDAVEELRAIGAVQPSSSRPGVRVWHAAPPARVVEVVRLRKLRPLVKGDPVRLYRQALSDAGIQLDVTKRPSGLVTAIWGLRDVRDRIGELTRSVKHELLSMQPELTFSDEAVAAAVPYQRMYNERRIDRGLVCLPPADGDNCVDLGHQMRAAGSWPRYASRLPLKLFVYDRTTALIPIDPRETSKGALEINDPDGVAALFALHRREYARPDGPRGRGQPVPARPCPGRTVGAGASAAQIAAARAEGQLMAPDLDAAAARWPPIA
jgi:hypothetical protein